MDLGIYQHINEDGSIKHFQDWYETNEAKDLVENIKNDFKLDEINTKIMLFGWYNEIVLENPPFEPVPKPEIITEPIKGIKVYDNIVDYTIENPIKLANSNLDSFKYLGSELQEPDIPYYTSNDIENNFHQL